MNKTPQKIYINDSEGKKNLIGASRVINSVANTAKINTEKNSPDDPEIKDYFIKVANIPYKADYNSHVPKNPSKFWKDNSGDCDDKSVAFADYLYKKGAKGLWIVTIEHESKEYSHSCVMWHDKIFDPTATTPIYNIDRKIYYEYLQKKGFKLWAANTYNPDYYTIKQELSENKVYDSKSPNYNI
jgi:hypothetical protein